MIWIALMSYWPQWEQPRHWAETPKWSAEWTTLLPFVPNQPMKTWSPSSATSTDCGPAIWYDQLGSPILVSCLCGKQKCDNVITNQNQWFWIQMTRHWFLASCNSWTFSIINKESHTTPALAMIGPKKIGSFSARHSQKRFAVSFWQWCMSKMHFNIELQHAIYSDNNS